MANILLKEKRFLNVGEICAIHLKDIKPIHLCFTERFTDDKEFVFYTANNGIVSDNDVTFIKYLGKGFFMDVISEQLFMTSIIDVDDIGTDNYNSLKMESKKELEELSNFWHKIYDPNNMSEFNESFSILMKNPLVIDIESSPFMSIDYNISKQFASQSLEQTKEKILSAKSITQKELKQVYNNFEEKIVEYYTQKNNSVTKKI